MNKAHKIVRSKMSGKLVVVSEKTKSNGKYSSACTLVSTLFVSMLGANSAMAVTNNADIHTTLYGEHAILAEGTSGNTAIEINNTGNLITEGLRADGIRAAISGTFNGDVHIVNSGDISIITNVDGLPESEIELSANVSRAIHVVGGGTTATGNIKIEQKDSTLKTWSLYPGYELYDASAIKVSSTKIAGDIDIDVTGSHLETIGRQSDTIYVTNANNVAGASSSNFNINITDSTIIAQARAGDAIANANHAVVIIQGNHAASGDMNIIAHNSNIIAAYGDQNTNGAMTNEAAAAIRASFTGSDATGNISIKSLESNLYTNGLISTLVAGTSGTGNINIETSGTTLARGNGASAIEASTHGGEVVITNSATVDGGWGAASGLNLTTTTVLGSQYISNTGTIGALSDQLLLSTADTDAIISLDNSNTLTGFMSFTNGNVSINNTGEWNIRHFSDSDGDTTRDTKSVSISDFGNGTSFFKNEALGVVRLTSISGENTVNTTGEYITTGALSISNEGIVQGQLLNLDAFENSGLIDLTSNQKAGDILVIGGGATAGTYGSGNFISNGGTVKLDTVLNAGGADSLSDLLVIDNSTIGSGGATKVDINVVSNTDQLTQGEGIKVIETLGTSEAGSFELTRPLATGLYEYVLGQGTADQNWYLTNKEVIQTEEVRPFFNPAIGAYLANQTAASNLFMHTLYDRQGHANNVAGNSEEKSSMWLRVATSKTNNDSANGLLSANTYSNLVHLGADIGKWRLEEGNLHLGLMGGYGQTDSNISSQATRTSAKGEVTGYSLGVYGTWFADEAKGHGLYVDTWAQYGWYKNKVTGEAQLNREEKYDSNSWTASLEAGYGFHLTTEGDTDVMLTPQIQIVYNNYRADDHQDGNDLRVHSSEADGVQTRVGARLYGRTVDGAGLKPYLEANWLYNSAKNELGFNETSLKDGVPKSRAEGKVGLQGTISENWKVWGHIGAQWGNHSYTRYEGQAGLNYQW